MKFVFLFFLIFIKSYEGYKEVNGHQYTIDGSKLIRAANGTASITILPETTKISGTSSLNYAFSNCINTLTEVIFPQGSKLEEIQPYAFYRCGNLQKISFEVCSSLKIIDKYSFAQCTKLSSVSFNEGLTTISDFAFSKTSIVSIHFPQSLITLGSYSFESVKALKNVTYAENCQITSMENCVFESTTFNELHIPQNVMRFNAKFIFNNKNITEVVLDGNANFVIHEHCLYSQNKTQLIYYPSNFTYMKEFTVPIDTLELLRFSMSGSQINTAVLPDSLIFIRNDCFRGSAIKSIALTSNIEYMEAFCFYACQSLSNVTFETTKLTVFNERAFSLCNFQEFNVPDGITEIGDLCFANNSKLELITLPDSIQYIGGGAVSKCKNNLEIKFRNESSDLFIDKENKLILSNSKSKLVVYFDSAEKDGITLPESVKIIGQYVFASTNIRSITVPDNSLLENIQQNAFESCTNLEYFYLKSNNLKTIGKNAFLNCINLKEFHFGTSIQTISESSFQNCISLNNITIRATIDLLSDEPESLCTLGKFCFCNCSSLHSVSLGDGVSNISSSCFQDCLALNCIVFPRTLQYIGYQAFNNSGLHNVSFENSINYKTIDPYSFKGAKELSYIEFGSYIEVIGEQAFDGTNISSLSLPDSITTLQQCCFQNNINLVNFTIQENSNLTNFNYGVFMGCQKLEKIECKSNHFIVNNDALFDKNSTRLLIFPPASPVRYFYIPQSVKKITRYSFYGCKNIKHIMIPDDSVEEIESYAFQNCANLTIINIPQSVEIVGINAFSGCNSLKCGAAVDNTTDAFISMLTKTAGFPLNALKDCSIAISCEYSSSHRFYSILAQILLICSH